MSRKTRRGRFLKRPDYKQWVCQLSKLTNLIGWSGKGWFFGSQMHSLIHQPTGVILTALMLPGNLDDRRAVQALGVSGV